MPQKQVSLAALALALLASSCSGRDARTLALDCRPTDRGRVFVAGGPSNVNAKLYRIDFCPFSVTEVPVHIPVGSVAARGKLVVIAQGPGGTVSTSGGSSSVSTSVSVGVAGANAAQTGGLFRVTRTGAVRLRGVRGPAEDPSIGPDGRIAYAANDFMRANDKRPRIYEYLPQRHSSEVLIGDRGFLYAPSWGPDGRVAVYRYTERALDLYLVRPGGRWTGAPLDGRIREDDVPGHLEWSSTGWLAASGGQMGTREITQLTKGSAIRPLEGWTTLAWSPDGKQLLLRSTTSQALALLDNPRTGSPRPIGLFPHGGIYDAAWAA